MGLTLRPSNPALLAVGRALQVNRERLIAEWTRWISQRMAQTPGLSRPSVERQTTLIIDIMIELAGPLRRQVAELWFTASDLYGRTAAARGLAAGEVVEELQHLRELLIRTLSETVVALPARQAMAAVLRLNRLLDRGLAHAVVGYTDALVESLLNRQGVPVASSGPTADEALQRLEQLQDELAQLQLGPAPA